MFSILNEAGYTGQLSGLCYTSPYHIVWCPSPGFSNGKPRHLHHHHRRRRSLTRPSAGGC